MNDMEHVCSRASVHACMCCRVHHQTETTPYSHSTHTIIVTINWDSLDQEHCNELSTRCRVEYIPSKIMYLIVCF